MKHKKYLKKCIHILTLYQLFADYAKAEVIISYIYKHIYELIAEMKYMPYIEPYEEFHKIFRDSYLDYYNKILNNSEERDLLTLFPNPSFFIYSIRYKFSFQKFFIGLVGRLVSYPNQFYGDPVTWNLGYDIFIDDSEELIISTCQYILLENYNVFQIEEEHSKELTFNFLNIICKKFNKYPGQPYADNFYLTRLKIESVHKYTPTDEIIQYFIKSWKEEYKNKYNSKIGEACNNIYKSRNIFEPKINLLYLCKEELKSELKKYKKGNFN